MKRICIYSEDTAMVRNDLMLGKGNGKVTGAKGSIFASWRDKLRITHEISAKHNSNGGKAFTYICRAADPMNDRWFEYIGDIYAVKERDIVPDESASLLIYFVYTSDINGVDKWYRFETGGEITTFVSDLPDLGRS